MSADQRLTEPQARPGWRGKLFVIIFEADTFAGKLFDLLLILAILASVGVVMLESVSPIAADHLQLLHALEWGFTLVFTAEYVLRLLSVVHPAAYAKSFFGVVDLLAILPTYLSLLLPGGQYLLAIRILRLVRIFRVLKLAKYVIEADVLRRALAASRHKILVFLVFVLTLIVIVGSLMYVVEGEAHGFTSIPRSIYWAIVTLTTVGYGDIAPQTNLGQFLASLVMITGYAIIAVPTGIVTVELTNADRKLITTRSCPSCTAHGHDLDAAFCKHCGERLEAQPGEPG